MKKNESRHWTSCPLCHILIFETETHKCPSKALAKKDMELDAVVEAELSTWDMDVRKFWKSKDVKFGVWLAEQERNE
jgi:hypothetical protein